MKRWARTGVLFTTLIGLAVAAWTFGATGWRDVLNVAGRIGPGGFALVCIYSLGIFGVLGAAWLAAAGETVNRLGWFVWARLVREAASDLLPFSQLGGIVVSLRTLVAQGEPQARAYASFLVDMTTEMASQLLFTLFGLTLMTSILMGAGSAMLRPLILGGTGAMVAFILVVFSSQRWLLGFTRKLAERFLPDSAAAMAGMESELACRYADRNGVAFSFLLNLIAWAMSGALAWLILTLAGVPIPIWTALSLESLIFTLRSVAFAIPGGIGVQEVAYVLVGPLFGLSPETALALAFAKRARDLAIALPALLIWQASEARALVRGT